MDIEERRKRLYPSTIFIAKGHQIESVRILQKRFCVIPSSWATPNECYPVLAHDILLQDWLTVTHLGIIRVRARVRRKRESRTACEPVRPSDGGLGRTPKRSLLRFVLWGLLGKIIFWFLRCPRCAQTNGKFHNEALSSGFP